MSTSRAASASSSGGNPPDPGRWVSLGPVVLVFGVTVLLILYNPPAVYEPWFLLPSLNFVFRTLISCIIAALAASVFLRRNLYSALLLGSGMLIYGIGSLAAALLTVLVNPNAGVTQHNLCLLIATILFLRCTIRIHQGEQLAVAATAVDRRRLPAYYGGSILLPVLIVGLVLSGLLPVFIIPGQGPTMLRQLVLILAMGLLVVSPTAGLLKYQRTRQPFAWWFALGLLLLLFGAAGAFFERAAGSLLSWTGRTATYLGGIYLLIAVGSLYRQARRQGVSVETAMAEFFADPDIGYRLLVEHSPDIISRFDSELRHIYVNPALEQITGVPPSFFIGRTIDEIGLDEPSRLRVRAALEAVLRGAPVQRVVFEFPTAQGVRSFDCSYFPEKDSHGRVIGVLAVNRDITDLQESLRRLEESESLNRSVVENLERIRNILAESQKIAHLGSFEYVAATRTTIWSEEEYRIYGLDPTGPSPAYDVLLAECIHPDDADLLHETFMKAVQNSAVYELEHRIVRPDGSVRWVYDRANPYFDEHGHLVRYVGATLDITERKQAETALQQVHGELEKRVEERTAQLIQTTELVKAERQRFFDVLETLPSYVCLLTPDYRMPFANRKFREWFSYDPNRKCHEFLFDRSEPCEHCETYSVLKIHEPHRWEWAGPNGCTYDIFDFPFIDTDGSLMILEMGTDITERKKAEEALSRAYAELEQRVAERTAELQQAKEAAEKASQAKSKFLSQMSHELRTPINGIMGMAHLASLETEKPGVKEYLSYLNQSAEHLLGVVNDILDLARVEAGRIELRREPFNLPGLLDSVINPFRAQADQKGLVFLTETANLPSKVLGDPGRLRQVLYNLLSNAFKFTESGEVELSAGPEEPTAEQGRLRFSVRDTGTGIPPDKLESIFDSFTHGNGSNHSHFGGAGLGLSISRQLVELMGGLLQVDSHIGRGSTFRFTLTLEPAEAAEPAPQAPAPGPQLPGTALRVLLAEDEVINRLFLQTLLTQQGHSVETAGNGQEALERLAREKFDLVVMDISMPVMNGEQALRAIRGGEAGVLDPSVKVVALTAHAIQGDWERFLSAGFDGYLSKPVNLAQLRKLLTDLQPQEGPKAKA